MCTNTKRYHINNTHTDTQIFFLFCRDRLGTSPQVTGWLRLMCWARSYPSTPITKTPHEVGMVQIQPQQRNDEVYAMTRVRGSNCGLFIALSAIRLMRVICYSILFFFVIWKDEFNTEITGVNKKCDLSEINLRANNRAFLSACLDGALRARRLFLTPNLIVFVMTCFGRSRRLSLAAAPLG